MANSGVPPQLTVTTYRKHNMLTYVKVILEKVSFDRYLFEKELRKSIARLIPAELEELKNWCYEQFSHIYQTLLDKCFFSLG